MRRSLSIAAVTSALFAGGTALADESAPRPLPPIRSAPAPYVYEPAPEAPPLAHRGFQAALRLGGSMPVGFAEGDSAMSRFFGPQLPLFFELGFKPDPHVFVGAYGSFAFGTVSNRYEDERCASRDCGAHAFHVGAEVQYHARPSSRLDPWVGYGIGYEWISTSGTPETSLRGPEYGRFMAGLDVRLSRSLGLGPFVDVAVARYTHRSTQADATHAAFDGDIGPTRAHLWLTVGLRLVLLP